MEHTLIARIIVCAALVAVAASSFTACASLEQGPAPAPVSVQSARDARAAADAYVEQLAARARMNTDTHRAMVRAGADRYVAELIDRARIAAAE